uniref:pyrrolidone-carboxylate peptidase-like n=1 Tax=Erigeron canadensis TaxID=72917 RepID=UPI001CB958DF|nr:pyrrolidone-carboxylate peptidase-like [Erigeron canadensis]
MGSEGPKNVVIHVTGFKKFNVFATNPTETLVSNLKSYVEKTGLPHGVSLGSCTILESAGDGALAALQKALESSISNENKSGSTEVVWLHMGLNGGASKFAIEKQAVNEATFSCPDELGWQPKRLPIVHEDGEITRIRETAFSVDAILEFLKNIKGCDAMISDDAGRFVCNYVYYHSLRFAEDKGHKSLFVHVPPFSRIDEETQMQFMGALLEAIALCC